MLAARMSKTRCYGGKWVMLAARIPEQSEGKTGKTDIQVSL